jgi:hypothetical protein
MQLARRREVSDLKELANAKLLQLVPVESTDSKYE